MTAVRPDPIVSVVVPVYNVRPWIDQCLASVASQSIGTDAMELVAVDDGSTDGTGAVLDAFAAANPWARVAHQANSGGPGAPRNAGVALARGRYVFFLDADDYLAPEAMERLVAMAERNGSDIVVARIVGVEGRVKRTVRHFQRDVDRADFALVARSGNVLKLFRRALIVNHGLAFQPGIPGGEDGDFMQRAYLAAGTISILGSYEAYFTRRRPGSQTTRKDRTDDLADKVARIETERILPVVERLGPGMRRDAVLAAHLARVAATFRHRWLRLSPEDRARTFAVGAAIVARWCSPRIIRVQPPRYAVRLYCLAHGMQAELERIAAAPVGEVYGQPTAEGRRIFAAYPGFRDGSGIPDHCFDMTSQVVLHHRLDGAVLDGSILDLAGIAYLALAGGTPFVRLQRRPAGPRHDAPVQVTPTPAVRDRTRRYPMAGFRASVDLATVADGRPLGPGSWQIVIGARNGRIERTAPATLRRPRRSPGRLTVSAPAAAPGLTVLPQGHVHVHVPPLPLGVGAVERLAGRWTTVSRRLGRRAIRLVERTQTGQVMLLLAAVAVHRPPDSVNEVT